MFGKWRKDSKDSDQFPDGFGWAWKYQIHSLSQFRNQWMKERISINWKSMFLLLKSIRRIVVKTWETDVAKTILLDWWWKEIETQLIDFIYRKCIFYITKRKWIAVKTIHLYTYGYIGMKKQERDSIYEKGYIIW